MNQFVFYQEDLNHLVTEINGTAVTLSTSCTNYPNIDNDFFLAQEAHISGQPDYTDLCVNSNLSTFTIKLTRPDTSTYTLNGNIFGGPIPGHRPF